MIWVKIVGAIFCIPSSTVTCDLKTFIAQAARDTHTKRVCEIENLTLLAVYMLHVLNNYTEAHIS